MPTIVDVVDEYDQPTGQTATKEEAHDGKLRHRVVAVYVFDTQGKLYIQVHKKSGGLLDHSVGGHVDAGEDYTTAAYREAAEELGLEGAELTELTTSYNSHEGVYNHFFGIYECHPGPGWRFVPNDEVEEIYPDTLEHVLEQMAKHPELFTRGFLSTMREYCRLKGL